MPSRPPPRADLLDPRSVRCVGIIPAMHKRSIAAAVRETLTWLKKRRIEACLPDKQALSLSLPKLAVPPPKLGRCSDLLLSMGGDGTLLATARLAAPLGKPVLGVNLGGFGFLATVPARPTLSRALDSVFAAPSPIQLRMMLEAVVHRGRTTVGSFLALNDIVVGKGAFSRLFRLNTSVSGEPISSFPADGMIVATPTGSTGYSLSAGGPVVDPEVRAIILTPICAHTLTARTLVVPADRVVEMVLPDLQGEEVKLTADGQEGIPLQAGDVIAVRQARFPARLVVLPESTFYRRLRAKLGWGSHR